MSLNRRTQLFLVLSAVFIVSLVVGDIIGGKLVSVSVFGLVRTISVGMIPFPLTFLLTDVLNEFYGKEAARFVSLVGLAMAIFSYVVIYLAIAIPISPITQASDWKGITDTAFNTVFASSQRILFASLVAYVIGQLIDISVFHMLKELTGHRLLWLRSTGSTVVSQLVDTVAIQTIAWYGYLPWRRVASIATTAYAVKLVVAIALTPFIYAAHTLVLRWLRVPSDHPENAEEEAVIP